MGVVIIGTLDTKGEEIGFARDVLEGQGVDIRVVDVVVMGDPSSNPTPRPRRSRRRRGRPSNASARTPTAARRWGRCARGPPPSFADCTTRAA